MTRALRTELELRFIVDLTRPGSLEEQQLTLQALEIVKRQRVLRHEPFQDVDAVIGQVLKALPPTLQEARDETERDVLIAALVRCRGNVSRTSAILGLSRTAVHDLLNKYDLKSADFKTLVPPAVNNGGTPA